MKKSLFFVTGLAFCMAGCTNDEVVSVNEGGAIDFRASVGTRAAETSNANFSEMFVSAFEGNEGKEYFSDVKFSKATAENDESATLRFTSDPEKYYWPGDALTFVAYAPSKTDIGGTLTTTKDGVKVEAFSPNASIKGQVDFMTATGVGNKNEHQASGVALNFSHNLSQIVIKAKNTNPAYVYSIRGVRIANVAGSATFDGSAETKWSAYATEKTNYSITYSSANAVRLDGLTTDDKDAAVAVSLMHHSGPAMLIPQAVTGWEKTTAETGAYIAVLVNMQTAGGYTMFPSEDKYGWVAAKLDITFEAGKKYVFTLDFSNGVGFVAPDQSAGEGSKDDGYENDNEDDNNTPDNKDDDDPIDDNIDPDLTDDSGDVVNPGDNILGNPIEFTVTVSDWTEETNGTGLTM